MQDELLYLKANSTNILTQNQLVEFNDKLKYYQEDNLRLSNELSNSQKNTIL